MSSAVKALTDILVALITPFTDDGTAIDEKRLKSHIDHMVDAGCHGLVPGGTAGELTGMTLGGRKQNLELCIEYAARRVPVVGGIGTTTTKDCIELAQLNYEQLQQRLSEIHEASNLDTVYYNTPSASRLTPTLPGRREIPQGHIRQRPCIHRVGLVSGRHRSLPSMDGTL
ncbi:uncharacterized protein Z519_04970 [Cladophialophora bantiana CBS 173.52]|uniref:Dihydrodipicolinate synthase n=1 Tax=Cladophialophora bantiana (strain ATCC 10958 / CBS 173.52 / CDC B-1940 / NIH 8579) TaxID=1442370 RepID=A0A0D2HVR0_CLAB1|nr:uncharacterized protein Z519_04970 [Cladophialophora bantiana CBS 173.52]KIW94990.1 hypothetical protein Z519_04970 [Cladophialophora bantiana CBS 173.52]